MEKLEFMEGNLVKEVVGEGGEGENVFVIEGLDEVEAKVYGRLQAQYESDAGGLQGGEQQEFLQGGGVCYRVQHEARQEEGIGRGGEG